MRQKLGGRMRYLDLGPASALTSSSLGGSFIVAEPAGDIELIRGTDRDIEIVRAVRAAGGSVAIAARRLGVTRPRIYQVLVKLRV